MTPSEFIQRYLRQRALYHFTDTRNLSSINSTGLLSRRELNRRALSGYVAGGNEWSQTQDDRFGLDGYVHLCFFNSHPMEFIARQDGRIKQSKFLEIDPEVLAAPGVKVSLGVSNKNDVLIQDPADAFGNMDVEVIFSRTDWKDSAIKERLKVAKKYEVLVPTLVARSSIRGL